MVKENRETWRTKFLNKAKQSFEDYPKCFVVRVDNVKSKQMQKLSMRLCGKAEMLFGKTSMMRRALRILMESKPNVEKLLPHLRGSVCLVFTKEELNAIKDLILLNNRKTASAKAGSLAPFDVFLIPQNTDLGPEKALFFQALNIPTKITNGTIEILNKVHLVHAGSRIGASEATLLNMLNIAPFTCDLKITQVYDSGICFAPSVLEITDDDRRAKLKEGLRNIAPISLITDYPTATSAPHSIINGFKNLLAISVQTDYTFPEAKQTKENLANSSNFPGAAAETTPALEEEKEEEPEAKKIVG